jgi:hypothetical protein
MARVIWTDSVGGLPRCDNTRSVPRKPVLWFGEVWLKMPDKTRSARSWRAQHPITRAEAQEVMAIMLDELIEECGRDAAVESGFRLECR